MLDPTPRLRQPWSRPLRAFWLAVLLAACSAAPELPRLQPDDTVLAFGDSLTHGTGAPDGQSYPAELERLTGLEVVERGVPGELSQAGRERLPDVLDEVEPALLILCHGGNDLMQRRSQAQLRANLAAMVETARERGIAVLLIAVSAPGPLGGTDVYAEVADSHGVPLVPDVIGEVLGDPALKSDRVHPNAEGYARIARAVRERLARAGALP